MSNSPVEQDVSGRDGYLFRLVDGCSDDVFHGGGAAIVCRELASAVEVKADWTHESGHAGSMKAVCFGRGGP